MKIFKIVLLCIMWFLLFNFIPLDDGVLHAADVENKRWSFHFEDCTISDALRQMRQVTGIDIIANQIGNGVIFSKSYKNQSLDQILKNLFREENYAMLWSYDADGLDAIDIWIFKDGNSRANFAMEQLSEQRLMKQKMDRKIYKSDSKPIVERNQAGKTVGDNSVSSQREKVTSIQKESNKLFVSRYSKPSGSGNMLRNPELSVPAAGIAPEAAEEEPGGASELNPPSPSPSPMPGVDDSGASESNEGISQHENQTGGTVPPPVPEKWHGLEPPPMPPGF